MNNHLNAKQKWSLTSNLEKKAFKCIIYEMSRNCIFSVIKLCYYLVNVSEE